MVDLGCGDGLGLILQAAIYPDSRFIGIDAMSAHIERGNAIINELGLTNITLRCQTFKQALESEAIAADYVAVQGVWSWVSAENQHALLKLVSHCLNPAGVAIMGYNCLPGWGPIAAFQKLIHSLAVGQDGTPRARFENAFDQARSASDAGMAALGETQFEWIDELKDRFPADYFAHEYLNNHWQPLWSGDAIKIAAEHGLQFQCHSARDRLREDFIFKAAQRKQLEKTTTIAAREIMADMFLNCWFRRDIFRKESFSPLTDGEVQSPRLSGYWMANQPKAAAEFSTKTTAGTLIFDNISAHHILDQLDLAPASLENIAQSDHPGTRADLLNTVDSLFMAGLINPVDSCQAQADPAAINDWLSRSEAKGFSMNAIATPHGPVWVERGNIRHSLNDNNFRQRAGL